MASSTLTFPVLALLITTVAAGCAAAPPTSETTAASSGPSEPSAQRRVSQAESTVNDLSTHIGFSFQGCEGIQLEIPVPNQIPYAPSDLKTKSPDPTGQTYLVQQTYLVCRDATDGRINKTSVTFQFGAVPIERPSAPETPTGDAYLYLPYVGSDFDGLADLFAIFNVSSGHITGRVVLEDSPVGSKSVGHSKDANIEIRSAMAGQRQTVRPLNVVMVSGHERAERSYHVVNWTETSTYSAGTSLGLIQTTFLGVQKPEFMAYPARNLFGFSFALTLNVARPGVPGPPLDAEVPL